jgi:hypothetical protein
MQNYKQTTKFTGLSSSLMLLINHFHNDFRVDRKNEFELWRETILLPTRGSCIYRVAVLASKLKIPTKVIVEDPKHKFPRVYKFRLFTKKEVYDAKFFSDLNFEEAKEKKIAEVRNFALDEIKDALKQNKIVLLRVNIGPILKVRAIPDYILLYGYGNNLYLWNNTITGQTVRINEKQMKEIFSQVKSKCKRDNRAIIFG